jgi:AbrB family looped-hinge helix DNA binding protein
MLHHQSEFNKDLHTVELGARGRLVLPATVRNKLELNEGDKFMLTLEKDGSVRLTNLRSNIAKLRGVLKQHRKGRKLVDELIAERKAEAKSE